MTCLKNYLIYLFYIIEVGYKLRHSTLLPFFSPRNFPCFHNLYGSGPYQKRVLQCQLRKQFSPYRSPSCKTILSVTGSFTKSTLISQFLTLVQTFKNIYSFISVSTYCFPNNLLMVKIPIINETIKYRLQI